MEIPGSFIQRIVEHALPSGGTAVEASLLPDPREIVAIAAGYDVEAKPQHSLAKEETQERLKPGHWRRVKARMDVLLRHARKAQYARSQELRKSNKESLERAMSRRDEIGRLVQRILLNNWPRVDRSADLSRKELPRTPSDLQLILETSLKRLKARKRGRPATVVTPMVQVMIERHFGTKFTDYMKALEIAIPDPDTRKTYVLRLRRLQKK